MKTMTLLTVAMLSASLTGCVTSAVISDVSEDAVHVQATGDDMAVIMAEARSACAIYDREPIQISYRCLDGYCITKDYLFACSEDAASSDSKKSNTE